MLEVVNIEDVISDDNVVFIDVRSEKEYAEDHIVNSINMPVLNNEERHDVGFTYVQVNKEEAIRKGVNYASSKIPYYYDVVDKLTKEGKKVVIYCFRGGMRSNSVAKTMDALNKRVYLLSRGYKAYRKYVRDYIEEAASRFDFIMLSGNTGVGKTKILTRLKEMGQGVIDLELMARHRGSVFGGVGYNDQTTQKMFESELVYDLLRIKGNKIYIESESPKVGNVIVPETFFNSMQSGKHILINTSIQNRVRIILQDYLITSHEPEFKAKIIEMLTKLKDTIGNKQVAKLSEYIKQEDYEKFTEELLIGYYDPLYKTSIDKFEYDKVIEYEDVEEAVEKINRSEN